MSPQPSRPDPRKGLSRVVQIAIAVAAAVPIILLVYVMLGYSPAQFWEDLRNLIGIGHHCGAGEHWSEPLNRCFPNG